MELNFRSERGQVTVLMAAALVVLFGVAGMVVDLGNYYYQKQKAQDAVDAGALAGAQTLYSSKSQTNAETAAINLANQNDSSYLPNSNPQQTTNSGASTMTATVGSNSLTASVDSNNSYVDVTGKFRVNTFFGGILGLSYFHTSVHARAAMQGLGTTSNQMNDQVIPIEIPSSFLNQLNGLQFNAPLQFNYSGGNNSSYTYSMNYAGSNVTTTPGNWGWINFNPNGGGENSLTYYIENGAPSPISIGNVFNAEPGSSINNIQNALQTQMNKVLILPVVDTSGGGGSTAQYKVKAFVELTVTNLQGSGNNLTIDAHFQRVVVPGSYTATAPNYGVTGAVLLQ